MPHHTHMCVATLSFVPNEHKMLYNMIQIQWIRIIILLQKILLQLVQHLTNFRLNFNRNYFVFYAKLTTPCFPLVFSRNGWFAHALTKCPWHFAVRTWNLVSFFRNFLLRNKVTNLFILNIRNLIKKCNHYKVIKYYPA